MIERSSIRLAGVVCAVLASGAPTAFAQTTVCVDIETRSWADSDREPPEQQEQAPEDGEGDGDEPGSKQAPAAGAKAKQGAPEPPGDGAAPAGDAPGGEGGEPSEPPDDEERAERQGPQGAPQGEAPQPPPPGAPPAPGPQGGDADGEFPELDPTFRWAQRRDAGPQAAPPAAQGTQPAGLPIPGRNVEPRFYLERLVEHYVTHRDGFEAVATDCDERITVELYPLEEGWTVFARYSGHAREEKVDQVRMDEFDALAHRLTGALLRDVSLQATLTRRTVLRADSEGDLRKIHGGTQFLLSIGTAMHVGELPTAPNRTDAAEDEIRLLAPLAAMLGLRGAYRAWALDAYLGVQIGTQRRASTRNLGGGHADYSVGLLAALHFLRYLSPDDVNSFYLGGGARFGVDRYRVISAQHSSGFQPGPDGVWGGGMNVDLLLGHEFMRASALHFFVELDVSLPAYVFESGDDAGRIDSWIPLAAVQIGLLY